MDHIQPKKKDTYICRVYIEAFRHRYSKLIQFWREYLYLQFITAAGITEEATCTHEYIWAAMNREAIR